MNAKVQERTPSTFFSLVVDGLQGAGGHGSPRDGQDCRPLPSFVSPRVTARPIATSVVACVAGLGGLAPWGRHTQP